jgi:Starch-binding associating with outer membrane
MNLKGFFKYSILVSALMLPAVACKQFLDINTDPNAVKDAPIEQVFTSATTSLGFYAGSDMHRYSALLTQQLSGQGAGATTQSQEYERYNIAGSDLNNAWSSLYSTILSDLELVIQKASKENSPNYAGCAKILKAYTYSISVDAWGNIPYSEALKFTDNTKPKFDDGATIYPALITLLDEGITDIKNATSVKSPGTNSTIYTGAWSASKGKWEAFANALKMRLWLHTSKVDKTNAVSKIAALSTGVLMSSAADNFQMPFFNVARQQNPIHQFELDRANYLFANATLVDMMNAKVDPRRPRYFTSFPLFSGQYKGAKGGDASPNAKYSRIHLYLRGDTTSSAVAQSDGSVLYNAYAYNGTAPVRMLTYAEVQFIRAEAAVLGGAAIGGIAADSFFRSGIRAAMTQAGVTAAATDTYIYTGANGTLTGTESEMVKKIIEEKFVANFGVVMEPWTDWRRTGFPTITPPANALVPTTPRSLFYPQSEIDLNPNAPKQKADMTVRVFWDK